MNPPGYQTVSIKTAREFWNIAVPFTIVIFVLMSYFLFGFGGKIKEWMVKDAGVKKPDHSQPMESDPIV